jgi:hypothetical protein
MAGMFHGLPGTAASRLSFLKQNPLFLIMEERVMKSRRDDRGPQ